MGENIVQPVERLIVEKNVNAMAGKMGKPIVNLSNVQSSRMWKNTVR